MAHYDAVWGGRQPPHLTELGEWDEAVLRDEIAGLLAEDFDLSLLGIADEDPEALGGDGPVEREDDIPEPPVTPVSVAGDLWQLGSHRLICGDSTGADMVGQLLGKVRPLLMVTDPPYGVATRIHILTIWECARFWPLQKTRVL